MSGQASSCPVKSDDRQDSVSLQPRSLAMPKMSVPDNAVLLPIDMQQAFDSAPGRVAGMRRSMKTALRFLPPGGQAADQSFTCATTASCPARRFPRRARQRLPAGLRTDGRRGTRHQGRQRRLYRHRPRLAPASSRRRDGRRLRHFYRHVRLDLGARRRQSRLPNDPRRGCLRLFRPMDGEGGVISAREIHRAHVATLRAEFAEVLSTAKLVEALQRPAAA